MNSIHIAYHKSIIGELILGSYGDKLCILDFRYRRMRKTVDNRIKTNLKAEFIEKDDEILSKAKTQIDEYLSGNRKVFDIELLLIGSHFQKTVWNALMNVEYATTLSYLELAKNINNEKAVRAVANANGANAIALIVPCHRIISSDGTLGGYGGGLLAKKRLLKIERFNILDDNEKYNFIGNRDTKYDDSFLTAVKTTNIFCLPSCSARKPNKENVIFYSTKREAVKNGYRACKVCKP